MNEVIDESRNWDYNKLISLAPIKIATSIYQSFLPSNSRSDLLKESIKSSLVTG